MGITNSVICIGLEVVVVVVCTGLLITGRWVVGGAKILRPNIAWSKPAPKPSGGGVVGLGLFIGFPVNAFTGVCLITGILSMGFKVGGCFGNGFHVTWVEGVTVVDDVLVVLVLVLVVAAVVVVVLDTVGLELVVVVVGVVEVTSVTGFQVNGS